MKEKERISLEGGNKKIKAVQYFAGFMVFMLVCTIVSRGLYAYGLPQVKTGYATRQSISHKIEASGTFLAKEEKAIFTLPDIHVTSVDVRVGEAVTEDTVLFQLDTGELEKAYKAAQMEKAILEQQKTEILAGNAKQKELDETSMERANEDLADTTMLQDQNLIKAQEAYDNAVKELAELADYEHYLQEQRVQSIEYQSLQKAAGEDDATQEDIDAFELFKSVYEKQLKEEWEEKKKTLEANVKNEEWNLKQAYNEREQALKQANREVSDVALAVTQSTESNIMQLDYEIEQKKLELSEYKKLLDQDGKVISGYFGVMKEIQIAVGEKTTTDTAMLLTDSNAGFYFTAAITEEQSNYLNIGDSINVSARGGKIKMSDIPVTSIQKTGDDTYLVTAFIDNHEITENDTAQFSFTQVAEPSECCVPLSALYGSSSETYVLLLQENETILGTEYLVEKRIVTVADKNETYASLLDAPLSDLDQIITMSDRMVLPGDTVRLTEENE